MISRGPFNSIYSVILWSGALNQLLEKHYLPSPLQAYPWEICDYPYGHLYPHFKMYSSNFHLEPPKMHQLLAKWKPLYCLHSLCYCIPTTKMWCGTGLQHQPYFKWHNLPASVLPHKYLHSLLFLLFPEPPFRPSPHYIKLALISRYPSLILSFSSCWDIFFQFKAPHIKSSYNILTHVSLEDRLTCKKPIRVFIIYLISLST